MASAIAVPRAFGAALLAAGILLVAVEASEAAEARVRIAVLADRLLVSQPVDDVIREEVRALLEPEFAVEFPESAQVQAEGSLRTARDLLAALLAQPDVDLVIGLGPLSTQVLADHPALTKPCFGTIVIDPDLQGMPLTEAGTSGKRNFTYLLGIASIGDALAGLKELLPLGEAAVLFEESALRELPAMEAQLERVGREQGVELHAVPMGRPPVSVLERLPPSVDGVVVATLLGYTEEEVRNLAEGLIARRMPSFALVGPRDVELGLLATAAPSADVRQIGRRVALQIQDTLLGANPADLPVRRELQLQLTLNMATARAIGLSPPFEVLNRAVIFHRDTEPGARPLTLQQVVEESVRVNLDLQSEDRVVAAGRQDVFIALSTLLPQASAATSYSWIDRDRAVGRAERATGAAFRAEQVIFDEGLLAELSVSGSSQRAREAFREQVRQDVVQATATAYLTVLRAAATERIRRENLRVTRANLELARTRRRVGAAAATEVYRWESQEANDTRDLVLAEADRQIAKLELNRILDRPLEETFAAEDVRPADLTYTFSHPRVQPFLETPARFRLVRDYLVLRGLERAPELAELDAEIRAQERRRESSRRAFYLPSVRAEGELEHFLDESGAGAGERLGDDTEWRVGVEASIPLVTGGRRLAESRQALENLRRLRIDRRAESKRVEDRVRSAATQASASLSAIDLTRRASDAARSNLDLVTESYARGAVDILDLLDAQGTVFTAEQEAASAVYGYMIDLLDLQRATGEFEFFQTPAEREESLRELERYLRSHASQGGTGAGGQP